VHVVATAGHVDHGKSTLVRALTGMEPDRFAEEQRRGMTIDLGYAWTTLGTRTLAFVDVPGHERFIATMLAGLGPAPAVLFVVAALASSPGSLLARARHIVTGVAPTVAADAVRSTAAVGGGGAPGVAIESAAVSLPASLAEPLRLDSVLPVVGHTESGRLLLDLIAVAAEDDAQLVAAVRRAASSRKATGED